MRDGRLFSRNPPRRVDTSKSAWCWLYLKLGVESELRLQDTSREKLKESFLRKLFDKANAVPEGCVPRNEGEGSV